MDKIIYGGDTETCKGLPMTLQFYSEDIAHEKIYFVDRHSATRTFLRWCGERQRNCAHVVYVHFLQFDLVEFLFSAYEKLAGIGGSFEFHVGTWRVSGCYGAPTYCVVSDGKGRTITIVDSYSFYRGSLDKAAQLFCPDLRKLRRPNGLGEKLFTARDQTFCEYAMRDAVIAYHIGKFIERMHREFDIRQAVSVADMAATIFRHKFLTYTIPQPSRDIVDASLLSYHGGKNNLTVERGWYEGVSSIDISSAFGKSMAELPAFSNVDLYKRVKFRRGKFPKMVNPWGVYCISGKLEPCKWPVIFSHSFKPLSGVIADIWVQGVELNEALASGELKLTEIRGHCYDADKDHQAPGLRHFVNTFYDLKEAAEDAALRYFYKTIPNSVYGKFIQTRKRGTHAYTDIDAEVTVNASDLVAGGMFHPFIASAITSIPRARIHRLEHHYQALHTATDGIFTQKRVIIGGRNRDLQPSRHTKLGDLTLEASNGTLLLFRNKCYVLYVDEAGKKTIPSKTFPGKHIRKEARHGFQGTVQDLERMAVSGERTYVVNRPRRLREAIKAGQVPNEFFKKKMRLKIGAIGVK